MADYSSRHYSKSEQRSSPDRSRDQDENGSNQFDHSRADPAPRLHMHFREYIDRLRCRCELEEECLQQDDRCRNSTNPADHQKRPNALLVNCAHDRSTHFGSHFPSFSTKPGQFLSAFCRFPCGSSLNFPLTSRSYCIRSRPFTICHASILIGTVFPRLAP